MNEKEDAVKLVLTSCLAVLVVASGASAQAKRAPAKTALEAEFKAMIDQYYTAWSTLNPDNAAKYYAKDADMVFYDVAPLKYNAWAEYKAGVIKQRRAREGLSRSLTFNDWPRPESYQRVYFYLSLTLEGLLPYRNPGLGSCGKTDSSERWGEARLGADAGRLS